MGKKYSGSDSGSSGSESGGGSYKKKDKKVGPITHSILSQPSPTEGQVQRGQGQERR
jgi:hypothetical protein